MKLSERAKKIIEYHERTKHHPERYARSPGFMDWPNQPVPFRVFDGAKKRPLPFIEKDSEANYFNIYHRKNNPFQPFDFNNIAALLELSLGLSSWKSYGEDKWALRMNPSSGNLHPTEGYLIMPSLDETEGRGGVYHYNPYIHSLEERTLFDSSFFSKLTDHFESDGFFIILSSIYWREAWKYGERAFRYSNHDVGHALAALSFSASLLGWKITSLDALSEKTLKIISGFEKTKWKENEEEHPDLLLYIHGSSKKNIPKDFPLETIEAFTSLDFTGEPNQLSQEHVKWEIIDDIAKQTVKKGSKGNKLQLKDNPYYESELPGLNGAAIIRQRRSAQAYDALTSISKEAFFAILDKTLPRKDCAPFDMELGEIHAHLLLFVHRVEGLTPGLYFLLRKKEELEQIKNCCRPEFSWETVAGSSDTLPLFLLQKGDFKDLSMRLSCQQSIASDGAFSCGIITRFRDIIENEPSDYRRLFWETGMIGQILYLEAEAHSIRGTGIGCFLDDMVHDLLGLKDNSYQSLYHFTMGGPIEDKRLMALPPYHHLDMDRNG